MAVSINEYEKALKALSEAIHFAQQRTLEVEQKIARDAVIQRFEFCVELAWKCSAKVLGSQSTAAKPVIREMLQNAFISNSDLWFDFIDARNKSSHSYEEAVAREVFRVAKDFLEPGQKLLEILKSK
jgi:nucleotidyltransferase substrate binding protein (TIGR01987 family)